MSDESARRPVIYAYTTATRAKHEWSKRSGDRGWIKVGYTERDARKRIAEQENSPEPVEILFEEAALTEEGEIFRDSAVHAELESIGAFRTRKTSGQPTEWFEASLQEVQSAYHTVRTRKHTAKPSAFQMRAEQERAVGETARYFRSHSDPKARHFLWNAKMRFGKTFAAYQLARTMGWRRLLVLTFKPAAEGAWREIIEKHVDFDGWQFLGKEDGWDSVDEGRPLAQLVSFQKLLTPGPEGGIKDSLELVYAEQWDCIVVDEYHFGAWRDGAKTIYDTETTQARSQAQAEAEDFRREALEEKLTAANWLYLSGTPFRALAQGEFMEDQIFNWTYGDEQTEKRNRGGDPANPYSELPELRMYAYRMGDAVREYAASSFDDEFDLNAFFEAKRGDSGYRFQEPRDVRSWLDWMHRSAKPGEAPSCAPYATPELERTLQHTVWFLPDIAACRAMKAMLDDHPFFGEYDVVLAAGGSKSGLAALKPVSTAIGDGTKTKTITLTCGKLLTGVTVPQWGGIFMLRNLKAAETYYQAAFRVQSPWSLADTEHPTRRVVLKERAFIFDFAPQRALDLIATYCSGLARNGRDQPAEVRSFLNFLPVLCYEDGKMVRLDENALLDYAYSGIGAAMLAKRWQSPRLVNLDRDTLANLLDNEALCDALANTEAFRNLRDHAQKVVNADDTLRKLRRKGKKPARVEQNDARKRRLELREKLLQFLCKVPLFMYLTDFREESLQDVIRRIETALFVKVTGLEIEHFDELCRVGVFDERFLNTSIYAFRRQEAVHLIEPGS